MPLLFSRRAGLADQGASEHQDEKVGPFANQHRGDRWKTRYTDKSVGHAAVKKSVRRPEARATTTPEQRRMQLLCALSLDHSKKEIRLCGVGLQPERFLSTPLRFFASLRPARDTIRHRANSQSNDRAVRWGSSDGPPVFFPQPRIKSRQSVISREPATFYPPSAHGRTSR